MVETRIKIKGDAEEWVRRKARAMERAERFHVRAGFFEHSRYPEGEYVASVAVKNEYGVPGRVPARPFMSQALVKMQDPLHQMLKRTLQRNQMEITEEDAERAGLVMQDEIQQSILFGDWKPNSEYTIARKGSDKPLIDTGLMLRSVTYRVERN